MYETRIPAPVFTGVTFFCGNDKVNIMSAWSGCNIIFVGFMGTGKSLAARRLAKRLGRRFVDTDACIEQEAEMSIAQIFATEGEAAFRQRERHAIARACQEKELVIATGGGAIVDRENARTMKASGPVICLTARPEVILQRVQGDTARPLLQGPNPFEKIQRLLADRAAAYARADITIDTSSLDPDAVVEATLTALTQAGMRFQLSTDH